MTIDVRRIITGHDEQGKAIVVSDGPATAVRTNPLRPGWQSTEVWRTNEAPAHIGLHLEADPTTGSHRISPNKQGTIIRIAHFEPESDAIRNLDPEKSREIFAAMGNPGASTFGKNGRHPLIHRTESVDYAIMLSGELYLVLDDSDVKLTAGDVVVQRGTNHSWSNRSNAPASIAFVLIDGTFEPELKEKLADR
jgi:mannose-6-phosphate isomerase-like protein (cupin superfamily)